MKAFALQRRADAKKSQDAYDIVYCLRNYLGGTEAVAREFHVRLPDVLLEDGISRLTTQFASIASLGPEAYARRAQSAEENSLMRREARERVNDLLDLLP